MKNDDGSYLDRKLHHRTAQSAPAHHSDSSQTRAWSSQPARCRLLTSLNELVEANRGMSVLNPLYVNSTSLMPTGDELKATEARLTLPVTFCLPPTSFSSPPLPPPLFCALPGSPAEERNRQTVDLIEICAVGSLSHSPPTQFKMRIELTGPMAPSAEM